MGNIETQVSFVLPKWSVLCLFGCCLLQRQQPQIEFAIGVIVQEEKSVIITSKGNLRRGIHCYNFAIRGA